MRVAVVNVSRAQSGGYRKHLERLVPLLAATPPVSEARVFFPESGGLRERVRAYRPDVAFVPTSRIVPALGCPVVIMVRNMEPLQVPFGDNPLRERMRNLGRIASTYLACRRATRVIAVSEHVRSFLERAWRLPSRKIGVVYHGVDAPTAGRRPVALEAFADRSFLFTAGSIRPARGLDDVVGALGALARRGLRPRVVIAGRIDPGMDDHRRHLDRLAADHGVAAQLIWPGSLSSDEMAWCFRSCRAFVMTSRAEACPNTVLEALAHGCVSISTDQPPMPEFFVDAARYYRARASDGLADQIAGLDTLTPAQEAALRAAATRRAAAFRWEDTARRTVEELTEATRR